MRYNIALVRRNGLTAASQVEGTLKAVLFEAQGMVDRFAKEAARSEYESPAITVVIGTPKGDEVHVFLVQNGVLQPAWL
jgi:hypothetical protein